jgi:hypothetical protein
MRRHRSPAGREENSQIEMFDRARAKAPERSVSRTVVGRAVEGVTGEDWVGAERARPDQTIDGRAVRRRRG